MTHIHELKPRHRPRHTKRVRPVGAVALVAFVLVLAAFAFLGQTKALADTTSLKNKPAPVFELPDMEGKLISLRDLKEVVLLDFFTTTCPNCDELAPHVQGLYEEYAEKGLKVFGVSMGDPPSRLRTYVADKKLTYPVLIGTSAVARAYQIPGVPVVVIIDRGGIVRHVQIGFRNGLGLEAAMERVIRELLGL